MKLYSCSLLLALALGVTINASDAAQPSTSVGIMAETTPPQEGNVEAGANLAQRCATCHSGKGAGGAGTPYLSGQRHHYLRSALQAYVDGQRDHAPMKAVLEELSAQDLTDLAAYYASLAAPWNENKTPAASPRAPDRRLVASGKALAGSCISCHGANGNSTRAGVPSLSALEPEYFTRALKGYFNGERDDPTMALFKASLSNRDIKVLAAYFSTLPRERTGLRGQGNATSGAKQALNCVACHGAATGNVNPTMPSLAGQNTDYLIKAIKSYRDGLRHDAMMKSAVKRLRDKDIRNIAAYYAALKPEPATIAGAKSTMAFDPVADGKRLAVSCNACHGNDGNSTTKGVPRLSSLHVDYLMAAIRSYQTGLRKHATMRTMVAYLDDADIEKISLYYATQEPARAGQVGKGEAASGRKLSPACTSCHGGGGHSTKTLIPSLAGQNADYLVAAMRDYRSGTRDHADMKNAVIELSTQDIANLAAYFAAQEPEQPTIHLPEAPQQLARKCNRCHGEDGYSTDPAKPRLAGQVESYLLEALQAYQNGTRRSSAMHAMSAVLSPLETKAIAAYYARR